MVRRRLIGIVLAAPLTVALAAGPRVLTPVAVATPPIPTVAAVGDIACKNPPGNNRGVCQYDDVAAAIAAAHPTRFLALGDNQYEYGLYQDYLDNYDVYFHSLLPITEPAPGNHEYGKSPTAEGYFRYFGSAARGGYYSFEVGSWHVISLNSAICDPYDGAPCGPGTPQYEWLKADLAAHPAVCTLAYWHHPLFDWEKYQNNHWIQSFDLDRSRPFWGLLYAAGADVVLTGHNHNYQRYLPMDPQGDYDPKGIVQFIVGTGGRNTDDLGSPSTRPLTFVTGQSKAFGFLDLTLRAGGYDWRWVGAPGQPAFVDAGSATCH